MSFRFVIMGAAKIAPKFVEAVRCIPDAEVTAVASKSLKRAEAFAEAQHIAHAYDDYEQMLVHEKPDACYIAVTPHDHARLSRICICHGIPVLCEKAMFQNSAEAEAVYQEARDRGVFVMEATWSRFLPATRQAAAWVQKGQIGDPVYASCSIGFRADHDPSSRYMNRNLGGGASKDITIYAFEQLQYVMGQVPEDISAEAVFSETGVDLTDTVSMRFDRTKAHLVTSFEAALANELVVYGTSGHLVMPEPNFPSQVLLYDAEGRLVSHFQDHETENGFVYEAAEVIRCVQEGCLESPVVPWADTLLCSQVFDRIEERRTI